MLTKSKEYLVLRTEARRFFSREIVDILLFGSAVRGKQVPRDFDICTVFRKNVDNALVSGLHRALEKKKATAHISALTIDEFFRKPHSLAKTVFFEGVSLLTGRKLGENFGLHPCVLYAYDLTALPSSKKVLFVYALKGRRGEPGVVEKAGGQFVAPAALIVPLQKDSDISELLNFWRVKYTRILIMKVD